MSNNRQAPNNIHLHDRSVTASRTANNRAVTVPATNSILSVRQSILFVVHRQSSRQRIHQADGDAFDRLLFPYRIPDGRHPTQRHPLPVLMNNFLIKLLLVRTPFFTILLLRYARRHYPALSSLCASFIFSKYSRLVSIRMIDDFR